MGTFKKRRKQSEPLLPTHGGYRNLKSFQVAQLAYDITVRFCDRYINRYSRAHDQMVQAARSGVQNIAEGSVASGTSKKMELKLTNVAKASLEELRLDYEDYLRHNGHEEWHHNDPRRRSLVNRRCSSADEVARWVRDHGLNGQDGQNGGAGANRKSGRSISSREPMKSIQAAATANAVLVLIGVAITLLSRQIKTLAHEFEEHGGFTERLYRVRKNRRGDDW